MLTSGQGRASAVKGIGQQSTRQTAGRRDSTARQRHRSAAKATGHGSETPGQLPEEAMGGQGAGLRAAGAAAVRGQRPAVKGSTGGQRRGLPARRRRGGGRGWP